MSTAVLVIDVQQGLCEGPDAAYACDKVIARINVLTQKARAAGVPVIFVQHENASGVLARNAPGWEIACGLNVEPADERVHKRTPDSFNGTSLHAQLQRLGVRHLVICGMHTEYCVDSTTRRSMALGYEVTLVEDGHTSSGNAHLDAAQVIAHHNATLSSISSFGPRTRLETAAGVDFTTLAPSGRA